MVKVDFIKEKELLEKKTFFSTELKTFLFMVVPAVVSTGTDAVLAFADRLFLSHYKVGSGEVYLNAGLVGSISAFVIMSFFIVVAGYSNTLVAQFLGAKKIEKCASVVSQLVFFSMFAYPLVLIIGLFIKSIYTQFGHTQQQIDLETQYTHIILFGAIFSILRSGIGGFFIGIQKTKVVMYANLLATVINIPLNYVLIFGVGIFSEMGIAGAAVATVISSGIALAVLLCVYLGSKINKKFHTRRKLVFDLKLFKKLLYFGIPSGVETFFGVLVFDFFIMMMSSYGETVGAAVTIAINWDSVFFLPMVGAGLVTTSLVGNALGARDLTAAKKNAKISVLCMLSFALLVILVLIIFAEFLVDMFLTKMNNAKEVRSLAIVMLRSIGIYLFFDALHISMSGVLRGAGDTKATMTVFLSISGVFAVLSFSLIYTHIATPIVAWYMFVGFAIALGIGMFLRFLQGRWKTIVIVDEESS